MLICKNCLKPKVIIVKEGLLCPSPQGRHEFTEKEQPKK